MLATGHSRIPVHEAGDKTKIAGLLLVKEMLLKARVRIRRWRHAGKYHALLT